MSKPLNNKLVVLTRDAAGNQAWQPHLTALGAQVYSLPTIETAALPLPPVLAANPKRLQDFDWLILTSAASLHYLLKQASYFRGLASESLKVAIIGPATASATRRAGLPIAFQPSHADSKTLGWELDVVPGSRVVWPHSSRAPHDLVDILHSRGAEVIEIPLYETRVLGTPDLKMDQLLTEKAIDFLVFASPSAVEGFGRRVSGGYLKLAQEVPAIAIGPRIAMRLARSGFTRVYTSEVPSISGIVSSLSGFFSKWSRTE